MNDDLTRFLDDGATPDHVREHLVAVRSQGLVPFDVEAAVARHESLIGSGGASASGLSTAKVVAALGAAAVVGGAVVAGILMRAPSPEVSAAPEAAAVTDLEASQAPPTVLAPAVDPGVPDASAAGRAPAIEPDSPAPEDEPADMVVVDEPQPRVQTEARTKPGADPSRVPRMTSPRADAVLREARLTDRAEALIERRPARALALLDRLDREFGAGFFREERDALRVLALVGVGRMAEAGRRGRAFLAAHPQSTFSARVERALAHRPGQDKGETP